MQAARMSHIPFSGIRRILETCSRLEGEGRDIVHLEIGRPDFDTPAEISAAGITAIENGAVHYTSNYGIEPFRRAIAEKFQTDNELHYDPDSEIIVTSGATEAVFIAIVSLVDPKQEVLVPDPAWTYEPAIRTAGGTPVPYPLDPDRDYQPDVEALEDRLSEDSALLVLNSPHNPTGSMLERNSIEAIRDLAVEHDVLVLSDEIYEKIRYDNRPHHSPAAFDGLFERTITVNGLSKAYSMTGWRVGYIGAPTSLVDPIVRLRQYTSTCAPAMAQHAGITALQSDAHRPLVEAFASRRELVCERIADIPGMSCPELAGAFYAFPTLPAGIDDDEAFARDLLEEAGIALVPGRVFGDAGYGHIRIAYSNSAERIDEAFDRLEGWL